MPNGQYLVFWGFLHKMLQALQAQVHRSTGPRKQSLHSSHPLTPHRFIYFPRLVVQIMLYILYTFYIPIICIVSRNSKISSISYTRSSRVYFPFATVPYLQIFAGLSLSKAEFPWLLWLLWTTRSGRRHGTAATLTKHTTPGRMSFLTRRHDVFVLEESDIISRFKP